MDHLDQILSEDFDIDAAVNFVLQERHFRAGRGKGRKYVKMSPASMTLAAVTIGSGLILWDKIQQLMTSFFVNSLQDRTSRDKIDQILHKTVVKISDVVKPHMKTFMTELQADFQKGSFTNMRDSEIKKYVSIKVTEHLRRSMAHLDPIFSEMNGHLKNLILVHVKNELLNTLFQENI